MTTEICPDWELTLWPALTSFLKNFTDPAIHPTDDVVLWFHTNLAHLTILLTEVTLRRNYQGGLTLGETPTLPPS
jgi:hypothetical protein